MNKIVFDKMAYESFDDYNDIMQQVFRVGCSLCGETPITFVLKNHPIEIGKLINQQHQALSDVEIEHIIKQPINDWQAFDNDNANQHKPTFLCDECWNTLI